ncbi:hypothetical protein X279_05065 [Oenococcus oeni IOEB_0501]|nr:hypothetical protein [Oenococcus oeni]KEP87842.1 hypothetical protein X279_05065 [Oenococcus oeni IOEB_0501]
MKIKLTIPQLKKEFTFKDSTKNIKALSKMMRMTFQAQIDGAKPQAPEPKTDDMTPEQISELEIKRIQEKIEISEREDKQLDQLISGLSELFGLDEKEKDQLEELSPVELGELLGQAQFRINNPQVTQEDYDEIISSGKTKKSVPEKG